MNVCENVSFCVRECILVDGATVHPFDVDQAILWLGESTNDSSFLSMIDSISGITWI